MIISDKVRKHYSGFKLEEIIKIFSKKADNLLFGLSNKDSNKQILTLLNSFLRDYRQYNHLSKIIFLHKSKVNLLFKQAHEINALLDLVLQNNKNREQEIKLLLEESAYIFLRLHKQFTLRDWVESIIVALILAIVIRTFVIQAFKIPTGSMRMTLIEGDLILVNKFIYGVKIPFTNYHLPAIRQPKRGDVVVFVYPEDKKKDFIKRLAALPGDTIEIKGGSIYINGKPASEPIFNQIYYYNRGEFAAEGQKIQVPANSYFVLGDNSISSKDSRYWGFVPKDFLLGQAMVIYWPPQRIRPIK